MLPLILAGGLAWAAPSGGELSAELGNTHNGDEAYDTFANNDTMPSRGLRVGLRFREHLTTTLSWHHTGRGLTLDLGEVSTVQTAYLAEEFALGLKADARTTGWLYPYATGQLLGVRSVLKFDEDPTTDDDPSQRKAAGFAPGARAALGLELRTPDKWAEWQLALGLDLGVTALMRTAYDGFGDMQPGGLSLRGALGVRF